MASVDRSRSITFLFDCGLRGYHVYKVSWTPIQGEILAVIHETGNPYDRHAIAAIKNSQIVGHLPKEISRFIRFILEHGAQVSVTVVDDQYRRSPLIQGGLEIPVKVTVAMEYSDINSQKLQKFEDLIQIYYKEPVNGKYDDATKDILKAMCSDSDDAGDSDTDEEEQD